MEAIKKLIKEIADKMEEAIKEAKYEDNNEAYIDYWFEDDCWLEISSENNDYYDIHFYPANDEEDEKNLPNFEKALYDAMPNWDDV